jgi:hypothetical protein
MIDTSVVRVHQHGASITRNRRQSMDRSRGVLTSKIHAVVDANCLPVQLELTAGQAHDNRLAGRLLSRLKSGTMLLADRGYDADWIRALARLRPPLDPRRGKVEELGREINSLVFRGLIAGSTSISKSGAGPRANSK